MKKNLKNELQEMKFLFGYKPGRVISEQNIPLMEDVFEDDIFMAEPDVMEPVTKPDTDRGVEEKPYRPGRPDRDPNRLPYTDPDTHPQGEFDIDFADPDVAPAPTREKERTREKDRETERPFDPSRRERDPNRLPYEDPDTHPQGRGKHHDSESEPFGDDEFESDSALEDLVMKYLKNRG
jgi:hypothetical protein